MLRVISVVLVALCLASCGESKLSHEIQVGLKTPWLGSSFLVEAGEFFAAQSDKHFFGYARALAQLSEDDREALRTSDEKQYDYIVNTYAPTCLSPHELALLKLSLNIREHSARVQLYKTLAIQSYGSGNLPESTFVDVAGTLYEEADMLREGFSATDLDGNTTFIHSFDHMAKVHPNGQDAPVLVLYTDFVTGEPGELLTLLEDWISDGYARYIVRPFVPVTRRSPARPTFLQGYGVQLDIKNMEYKVVDDQAVDKNSDKGSDSDKPSTASSELQTWEGIDFKVITERRPDLSEKLGALHDHLQDQQGGEVTEVQSWKIRDLGILAAERILAAPDRLAQLQELAQNFPQYSAQLTRAEPPNRSVRRRYTTTSQYYGRGGGQLLVNGHQFDVRDITLYQLSKFLQEENKVAAQLRSLDLHPKSVFKAMTAQSRSNHAKPRFDLRDNEAVQWLNDLENDEMYKEWPKSVKDLLDSSQPGQVKFIAKNLFNTVAVLDLSSFEGLQMIHVMFQWLRQNMPARVGVVFASETPLQQAIVKAFFHAKKRCPGKGFSALTFGYVLAAMSGQNQGIVDMALLERAHNMFKQQYCPKVAKFSRVMGTDLYDKLMAAQQAYINKNFPEKDLPKIALNGILYPKARINDYFVHYMNQETQHLTQLINQGDVNDDDNIYDSIMESDGVYPKFIPAVFAKEGQEESQGGPVFIPSTTTSLSVTDTEGAHTTIDVSYINVLPHLRWFTKGRAPKGSSLFTLIVVTDLTTPQGLRTALGALSHASTQPGVRVAVMHNQLEGEPTIDPSTGEDAGLSEVPVLAENWPEIAGALEPLFAAVTDDNRGQLTEVAKLLMNDVLDSCVSAGDVPEDCFDVNERIATYYEKAGVKEQPTPASPDSNPLVIDEVRKTFFKRILGLSLGQTGLIANVRLIRVPLGSSFPEDDIKTLVQYEVAQRYTHLKSLSDKLAYSDAKQASRDSNAWFKSDALVQVGTIIGARPTQRQTLIHDVTDPPRGTMRISHPYASAHVECTVNPLSTEAQKLAPILMYLRDSLNASMTVVVAPKVEILEMPLKSYYRFVMSEEPSFDPDTGAVVPDVARFTRLPERNTLTLKLDTPTNWLVTPSDAAYDMDNIRLESLGDTPVLRATYQIDRLLVQGHAHLVKTGQPPQGLQIRLSAAKRTNRGMRSKLVHDTVVMHNLGFYQLHAMPGVFGLSIDRGLKITAFDLVEPGTTDQVMPWKEVVVKDLVGDSLYLAVKQRETNTPLSEEERVSEDDGEGNGLLGNMWGWMSGANAKPVDHVQTTEDDAETINIFSLASGHLYERFLKVMCLSLVRQTKNPVKFWFLNNFLSPKFKKSIPHLAKKYNFDYELVTYQWPRWLRAQTEKQRIIWGYKILFLDVLFPLGLKKVIVVDSDQIVRADMLELWNMDLQGRPLAYTPFCTGDNMNEATKGFRFWDQGFWKDHLRGRPYHISALYVIDLERFRTLSAGDTLRQMYQQLTADASSLANLDQDLPNYAQSAVPIFSLPEEWLYCETWCSAKAKKKAKTIDLCNNPLTKTPKLDNARAIVPEWVVLDEEIRSFEDTQSKVAGVHGDSHEHAELPPDLPGGHDSLLEGVDDEIADDALGRSLQKDGTVDETGMGLQPDAPDAA